MYIGTKCKIFLEPLFFSTYGRSLGSCSIRARTRHRRRRCSSRGTDTGGRCRPRPRSRRPGGRSCRPPACPRGSRGRACSRGSRSSPGPMGGEHRGHVTALRQSELTWAQALQSSAPRKASLHSHRPSEGRQLPEWNDSGQSHAEYYQVDINITRRA